MEFKRCSKCKEWKSLVAFGKCKSNKDGLQYVCKACRKEYRDANKYRINKETRARYASNREEEAIKRKIYYDANKEKINARNRKYINKEKKSEIDRKYREVNKERLSKRSKAYYLANRTNRLAYAKSWYYSNKNKVSDYNNSKAKYENYANRLTKDECARLASDGVSLEVKCRYCGKYFVPTILHANNRVKSLDTLIGGDRYLYCSDNCKAACPVYNQSKFPKGFKKASSREVDPLVRQLCFERDNWKCQICGKTTDESVLHCHHIEGYAQNPRLGNDVENVITLCKECHKDIHKLPGCNYYELQCKNN